MQDQDLVTEQLSELQTRLDAIDKIAKGDYVYIIEYDLPSDGRYRFYRQLSKLGVHVEKSTRSVYITKSCADAKKIASLAVEVGGTAKIWLATRII